MLVSSAAGMPPAGVARVCEGPYTVLVSGSNSWTPAGSQSACLGAAAAGRRVPAPPWLRPGRAGAARRRGAVGFLPEQYHHYADLTSTCHFLTGEADGLRQRQERPEGGLSQELGVQGRDAGLRALCTLSLHWGVHFLSWSFFPVDNFKALCLKGPRKAW